MGVSTQRSEVRENAGMSEHGSTSDGSEDTGMTMR